MCKHVMAGLDPTTSRPPGRALAAALAFLLLAFPAFAQQPFHATREVRLLCGFAPGGTCDLLSRLLAEQFTTVVGNRVVVENRTGASGMIAGEAVARATPDGHTLLLMPMALASVLPVTPGLRMPFDVSRAQMRAQSQIIQDNLRQVGLEVKLEPLERSVYYDRVFAKRDFDLMLGSYFSAGDPAIGYTRLYNTYTGTSPNTNASGYANPKVDELLTQAATAVDRAVRADLYKQLQVILNEDLPTLVLFDEETVDTASKKLSGVFPALDARDQWAGVKRLD